MFGDLEDRFVGNPAAIESPVGQDIAVIGLVRSRHGEFARPGAGHKRPFLFGGTGEAQQKAVMTVPDEIMSGFRRAALGEIIRCGTKHARAIGNLLEAQR